MLEDYLVEHLPAVSQLDTFGCELTLLDADSQHALCDPIQEELWNNTRFRLIVRDCFRSCSGKEQLQRDVYEALPKAIRVPVNDMGTLPAKAFFSLTRLRHVQMESGFHTIDRQAWRYCPSLRIVKLPETVGAIEYASFQGCYALEVAEMPGCVFFGVRPFSECCALEKVGVIIEKPCRLANGAVIAPYAFESCAKLSQIALPHVCAMTDIVTPSSPPGGLSHGSFLTLGEETIFLGHRAFENCKQLSQVDISSTKLNHLHMHTFSHCQSLQKVILPPSLREIRAEAFVGCTALSSIALPEQIRYIGHRAFGGCSRLAHLAYRRSRKTTWRRPYAAHRLSCIRQAQAMVAPLHPPGWN